MRTRQTIASALDALNTRWHRRAMIVFTVIVLGHWAEHVLQAIQLWVLGWPLKSANGALGLLFPWLVRSESLHYGYAVVMLVGLIALRPAFLGRARLWWDVALVIQVWHHFEHALLLGQVIAHRTLFGAAVPTSLVQLVVPRVELHLFYNAVVFIPMVIAAYYHVRPRDWTSTAPVCTCRLAPRAVPVTP